MSIYSMKKFSINLKHIFEIICSKRNLPLATIQAGIDLTGLFSGLAMSIYMTSWIVSSNEFLISFINQFSLTTGLIKAFFSL